MLWTALLAATALACEALTSAAQVIDHLGAAEAAWTQLDRTGFQLAYDDLTADLPCVRDPLTPADAAAIHRVEALDRFLAGDRDAAARAYSAAHLLEPGYTLPQAIAPDGNPLRAAWLEGTQRSPGPSRELDRPAEGALLIDGSRSLRRALERPVVFQRVDEHGRVADTAYLRPGDRLPPYRAYVPGGAPSQVPVAPRPTAHRPFVAIAGVAAAGSAGLWALSLQRADTFWDPTTPAGDLAGLQRQTNGLIVASVTAGVGSAAIGAIALWVRQR